MGKVMSRFARVLSAASALALLCAAAGGPSLAQPFAPPPPATPYPMPADRSPETLFKEFNGMWVMNNRISIEKYETIPQPLTPKYQAKKEQLIADRAAGRQVFTADAQCIPQGMPRQMDGNFEVLVRPDSLGILTGGGGLQVRNIWTDGRKHTPEAELFDSFSGESLGHWEGDTLVVDTIGLRPSNEVLYGVQGHKLHVVERMHKTGPDALQIDTVVYDPAVFKTPWTYTFTYKRSHKQTLTEQNYCVGALDREVDKNGKETFDLTPPPDPRDDK
jgi:hypothetical protein